MDFEHILDDLYMRLNECRTRPHHVASQMQSLRSAYNGNLLRNKIRTREGPIALENLLNDLRHRREHDNKLKWSFALHLVADEHASLLGEQGILNTEGTRWYRSLPERLRDFAIIKGKVCEVYEFGGKSASQILEELLIDDGLASRKRRNTLLDNTFNYIGIGSSYHESQEACTVIILAEDIISLVAPDETGKFRKRKPLQPGEEQVFKESYDSPVHGNQSPYEENDAPFILEPTRTDQPMGRRSLDEHEPYDQRERFQMRTQNEREQQMMREREEQLMRERENQRERQAEMERQRKIQMERRQMQRYQKEENYDRERAAKSDVYHHSVGVGENEPQYQSNHQPKAQSQVKKGEKKEDESKCLIM